MKIKPIISIPRDTVDKLLSTLPFFRELRTADQWQYDLLLQNSRVVDFDPGETVMRAGDIDTWMYFVVKGKLDVYPGDSNPGTMKAVSQITPGEVFGDLAILTGGKRMATIVADPKSKEISLFGTDFKVFGELDDVRLVNLNTKLLFFRNMVNGIRWKLEVYRMQHATHPLMEKIRAVKVYIGPKGTKDELHALCQQAKDLSGLLGQFNAEFGQPAELHQAAEIDPTLVKDL